MSLGQSFKPAIAPRWASALRNGRVRACALGIALLCATGMILLGLCLGPAGKIDANRIPSPWDRSMAPPPCMKSTSVRIIAKPRPHAAPKPQRTGRFERAAATRPRSTL